MGLIEIGKERCEISILCTKNPLNRGLIMLPFGTLVKMSEGETMRKGIRLRSHSRELL